MIDYDAIGTRRWDDNLIREAFIDDGGVMGAIFDAWLRSVKAEVWDECVAHLEVALGQEVKRLAYADNPYREDNG